MFSATCPLVKIYEVELPEASETNEAGMSFQQMVSYLRPREWIPEGDAGELNIVTGDGKLNILAGEDDRYVPETYNGSLFVMFSREFNLDGCYNPRNEDPSLVELRVSLRHDCTLRASVQQLSWALFTKSFLEAPSSPPMETNVPKYSALAKDVHTLDVFRNFWRQF
jgi:hypothetical protein